MLKKLIVVFVITFLYQHVISQNALSAIKDSSMYGELRGKIANQTFLIDRDSTNFYAIAQRSSLELQMGDYKNCVLDNNRLLRLNPNSADAYCNRALAYCFLKDYKSAIKDANKQVELEPTVAMSYYNRAYIKGESGDYKEAIEDLDKAITIRPDYYKAFANRGYINSKLKKHSESLLDYNKALEINPDYIEPLFNRFFTKFELKDYAGAIADFVLFNDKMPFMVFETNEVYLMLEKAYTKIGDTKNATMYKAKADAYTK